MVAEKLNLEEDKYMLSFQSRFGTEEWLQPYIDEEIVKLAKNGVKNLHIVSPGFSVDCLETLEEIKIQYDELFKENGGEKLHYIPCLNDHDDHIKLIDKLIKNNMSDWYNENEAEEWFRELRGRLVSMIEKYESDKVSEKRVEPFWQGWRFDEHNKRRFN